MNSIGSKVRSLGFDRSVAEQMEQRILELHNLGIQGVENLIKKLNRAPDLATFRDYWLEGTYSLVFAANNSLVTMEPCGEKGPDMLIKINGCDIYAEVKHFRQVPYPTNRKARFISSAIKEKLTQILDNEINIVVIRNGRLDMSIWSFYKGIYLCKALCRGNADWAKKWSNLSGIIMDMPYFDSRIYQPIYSRFFRSSANKVPDQVKSKLNAMIQGQVEIEHQKIQ